MSTKELKGPRVGTGAWIPHSERQTPPQVPPGLFQVILSPRGQGTPHTRSQVWQLSRAPYRLRGVPPQMVWGLSHGSEEEHLGTVQG